MNFNNGQPNKGMNRTRNEAIFHLLGTQRAGYPRRYTASLNSQLQRFHL